MEISTKDSNRGLEELELMFQNWSGMPAQTKIALPRAGGDRQYFRLQSESFSAIGVESPDLAENKAFLSFSKHFRKAGVPVPEIFAQSQDSSTYLQEDLGDLSLLQFLQNQRQNSTQFPQEALEAYKNALAELAKMQIVGGKGLDYSLCIPRPDFDLQSMRWDLSYFKYYFLKLAKVPFDEQGLENDFEALANWLCEADCQHFMFRDFQARNIMIKDGKPWFIDYQGGRRGALQYDVASLLFQAKADLPNEIRAELLDFYIDEASKLITIDREMFKDHYRGYVLIRMLQTLGSYGFRGFYERRPHFRDSIPFAMSNIGEMLDGPNFPIELPSLWAALRAAQQSAEIKAMATKPIAKKPLKLRIKSFSYKTGLPEDPSGNGGGFYFDCRAVHNPGRYDEYKHLTGRDQPVISYLEGLAEAQAFFRESSTLVEASVRRYLERGFTDLMVCFGCTGGQHRSVYFADRLAKEIGQRFPVEIEIQHVQQEIKNWIN